MMKMTVTEEGNVILEFETTDGAKKTVELGENVAKLDIDNITLHTDCFLANLYLYVDELDIQFKHSGKTFQQRAKLETECKIME